MSGVSANGTIGPGQGIGSTNYDYLQHTPVHPIHNSQQQQQQHLGYYHQQHNPNIQPPQPEPYPPNNQQYYQQHVPQINQQHYYQQDSGISQQNESWLPTNTVHGQQYHQQQAYYPPDPQQYQQNHSYHQQQQHPPIHQLSSFVNHAHNPHSPPQPGNCSTAVYPTSSSTASSGYVSQASPPPRSLSPIRPGPGSSPGAVTNHMMPVRLQNMAKGARTKAGMRKLMQMQEQQGQSSTSCQPPIKTPPSSPKKSKGKKSPSTSLKIDSENSSSLNSTASSVEEAIEAVLVTGRGAKGSPIGATHSQSGRKTPPAALSSSRIEKMNNSAKVKVPENSNSSNIINSGMSHGSEGRPPQSHSPRSIKGKRGSISQETLAYLSQSQEIPAPSDLLFEKLGLNLEKPSKRTKSGKTKASPPKKRKDSSSEEAGDPKSFQEELVVTPRTRRSYSGSTDTNESFPKKTPAKRSPSPKRKSVTPTTSSNSKRKGSETPKANVTPNGRKSRDTPKVKSPAVKKEVETEETPLRAYKKKGRPPSATGSHRKKGGSSSGGKTQTGRKSSTESIPADAIGASIQAVAAAILTPNTLAARTTKSQESPQSNSIIPRIKRKYTKRAKPITPAAVMANRQGPASSKQSSMNSNSELTDTDTLTPAQSVLYVTHIQRSSSVTPKKPKGKLLKSPVTPTNSKAKKAKKTPAKKGKTVKGSSTPVASVMEIEEATPARSIKPELDTVGGVLGSPGWIDNIMEKRSTGTTTLKRPTVRAKPSTFSQPPPTDMKKEPGPSLKVKHGAVKFYRGSVEEDVDESLKKLDHVLKDNVSRDCDDDTPWLCIFCGLGPHDMRLGDLFGPYFVEEGSSEHNLRGRTRNVTKKEVWVHTDCALWAGDVMLVGSTLRNLDEAVFEAGKVVCKICQNVGATIGCLKRGCPERAHYPCAKINDWNLNAETFHSHCRAHLSEVNQKPHLRSTAGFL